MRVAVPHNLGRDEVRRRLRARSHEIADHIPGGMAEVSTAWRNEDTLEITISAIGQVIRGDITVEEREVVFVVNLPPALGFIGPLIEGAIRQRGQKLLT